MVKTKKFKKVLVENVLSFFHRIKRLHLMVLDNGFVKVTQKVIYDAKKTQHDGITRIKFQHFEISHSCFLTLEGPLAKGGGGPSIIIRDWQQLLTVQKRRVPQRSRQLCNKM